MQGLFTAAALLAGDTLVRSSEQRLNRGTIPASTPRFCIKGYLTASAHKLTHPKGIKAASGIEEGFFFLIFTVRGRGSPNLQCEMQHLRTMLNLLAPYLAIFKKSTSLAFFYNGRKDTRNCILKKRGFHHKARYPDPTPQEGCRQILKNQPTKLWGFILSLEGEKFPFTLQRN